MVVQGSLSVHQVVQGSLSVHQVVQERQESRGITSEVLDPSLTAFCHIPLKSCYRRWSKSEQKVVILGHSGKKVKKDCPRCRPGPGSGKPGSQVIFLPGNRPVLGLREDGQNRHFRPARLGVRTRNNPE